MDKFERWFINQDFYTNMRFIHGDALFIKDGDVYRVLPVQMTWVAWQARQAEIDEKDKLIEEALSLIQAWGDQSYRDDAEQLIVDVEEALRGERE